MVLSPTLLIGLGTFFLFYISSVTLMARAERHLSPESKEVIKLLRYNIRPFVIIFIVGLIAIYYFRITSVWLYLFTMPVITITIFGANIIKSTLPSEFKTKFITSLSLLYIGICALSISFGYGNGYTL